MDIKDFIEVTQVSYIGEGTNRRLAHSDMIVRKDVIIGVSDTSNVDARVNTILILENENIPITEIYEDVLISLFKN